MPIYEFQCARCGIINAHVLLGSETRMRLECENCGSRRMQRIFSAFAVIESESSRVARFGTSRPTGENFYRDSRNVGLWAKKRAKEIGGDLGEKFEATLEKARSGKLVKELT